ncbi:MAG: iron ABC transporter permease [Firmicutes bacterium]|uniref:Iron ABC transporter permease n=1 Tax=Candidatus Gallilactobacillus intestinavium TaxID=2840838 RepID=A0A9D9H5R6_9LACO|nr:iron ABC transporter permease [Candidatus Gallilactobacillus intestinavium]
MFMSISLLVILIGFSLCIGRIHLSLITVGKCLLSSINIIHYHNSLAHEIIFSLRMPRIIAAIIIGAALSLAGTSYQAILQNPLVSPDFLGVSNGAALGAALAIILNLNIWCTQLLAFTIGLLAVLIALVIKKSLKSSKLITLVLSGMIISSFMQACLGLVKYLADPENQLPNIVYWQLGSLEKISWNNLKIYLPIIIIAVTIIFILRWRMNVLSLPDQQTTTIGINRTLETLIIIILATILTACSICLSGPIGWIGLIIPHISRLIIGNNNQKLIPFSIILGSCFLLFIDTIARSISVGEIPLSILTGFIGAPLFIWILIKNRRQL